MNITTMITRRNDPNARHHVECDRDHTPDTVIFTSTAGKNSFGQARAVDCLLYEMEDAVQDSIYEAVGHDCDDEAARQIAVMVVERADTMRTNERCSVRHRMEVLV